MQPCSVPYFTSRRDSLIQTTGSNTYFVTVEPIPKSRIEIQAVKNNYPINPSQIFTHENSELANKVEIFTEVDPTRSYSCLIYLADSLIERGIEVRLFCKSRHFDDLPPYAYSIYQTGWGKIPVVRNWIMKIQLISHSLTNKNIIVHELAFHKTAVLLKKFFKRNFIHFATELFDERDEPKLRKTIFHYQRNIDAAALLIDVNPERLSFRHLQWGRNAKAIVLRNSIPSTKNMKHANNDTALASTNIIHFVYSGAAYAHRDLSTLIDALNAAQISCKLTLIVYGPREEIENIKAKSAQLNKVDVTFLSNVSRSEAITAMRDCDVGLVTYKPSATIGNLYAEPTKFFEYLSAGLKVISYNNIPLAKIIHKYNCGWVMESETTQDLSEAMIKAADSYKKEKWREKIRKIFDQHLSYEHINKNALDEISSHILGVKEK